MNRTLYQGQPGHLVTPSPWPLLTAVSLFSLALSNGLWRHGYPAGQTLVFLSLTSVVLVRCLWFRDVDAEGSLLGNHTILVQKGLRIGFIRFLISEIRVFFSVFWAFFHSALSPSVELGACWPPVGIESLDYLEVPLLNTVILLSSGAAVTYAHHCFRGGRRGHALLGMVLTILLALIFTGFQGYEYYRAPFTRADNVYGSTFFFATGLHGRHVILGSLRLTVALARIYNYHVTAHHHVGYESSILYFHRVQLARNEL
jgi:cytochrome c oxidase subunit 3